MFKEIIPILDRYPDKYVHEIGYESHLVAEVKVRLEQLQFIIERVRLVETEGEANAIRRTRATMLSNPAKVFEVFAQEIGAMSVEAQVLTEAFYNCAWRIYYLIRQKPKPLPGISFECVGVRDVRNQLMLHPEKHKIFSQSFVSGGVNGPVLKASRPAGTPTAFVDKGLYVNAQEFASNLSEALEKAIAAKP
jgi:hypothetical protein